MCWICDRRREKKRNQSAFTVIHQSSSLWLVGKKNSANFRKLFLHHLIAHRVINWSWQWIDWNTIGPFSTDLQICTTCGWNRGKMENLSPVGRSSGRKETEGPSLSLVYHLHWCNKIPFNDWFNSSVCILIEGDNERAGCSLTKLCMRIISELCAGASLEQCVMQGREGLKQQLSRYTESKSHS